MAIDTARKNIVTGISLASLAAFIWAGNFIIARGVIKNIPPISLAFFRWLLASVVIFPFAYRHFKKEWQAAKKAWHYLFWTSLTGVVLFNTFVYIGAHYTSAINLALIGTTTSPIIATILARIFLGETIGPLRLLGLILCITGVLFLLSKGDFSHLMALRFSTGDLWVLAAGCCFAVYNTLVKKKPSTITSINFLFLLFSLGTLLLLPFYLWESGRSAAIEWNGELIFSIAYLGIGASVICFWIWNIAIGKLGAARTILFGNLIPVFSTLGAIIFLHEKFTSTHIIGMAIVFTGILLANLYVTRSTFKKSE